MPNLKTNSMNNPEKSIRVYLIEQQSIVRAGLRMLIASHSKFAVIGEAASYTDLSKFVEQPDIILLDINSLDLQEISQAIPKLLSTGGSARVLLLTDNEDQEATLKALRLGAMGLINKNESAETLLKAIERVHAGEVWINRSLMAQVLGGLWQAKLGQNGNQDPEEIKIATLTEREREVVTLIGEGLRNRQIAERLFISEITVRHHLTSIFDKLGVSDRFELAIYSYRHGLAKLPI